MIRRLLAWLRGPARPGTEAVQREHGFGGSYGVSGVPDTSDLKHGLAAAAAMFPQHTKTPAPAGFRAAGSGPASADVPPAAEETVGLSRENSPLLRVHGTDQPTSDLLYEAAGALRVFGDKHGRIPALIAELRDRAAMFLAIED